MNLTKKLLPLKYIAFIGIINSILGLYKVKNY